MLREIHEQPEVLGRVIEEGWGAVHAAARALRTRGFRSVMIAARGTSDNAALYAKYLFEVNLGTPTALASPSAFTIYESEMNLGGVLAVGISQSGESRDVLETVRRAGDLGAATLSLTNDEGSALAQAAEFHLPLRAGKEESVAATKTYTAELLTLYLFVEALNGRATPGGAVRELPEQVRAGLKRGWEGTARYRYADYLVVTSRGYNLATAQEAALKLMETSYVVAQAFSAADLRHGPIAMIGRDFPVIAIIPPGRTRPGMVSLVRSLRQRGADVAVVCDEEGPVREAPCGFLLPGPCPEELSPVLYAVPLQVLAHDLARLKRLDPDAPRGLSKVTETW
ncbi:SIS domain-containing protein [Rubrobacter taiwanensis]|jgi:glucosamine--fructose-6-phosphate aminotransferase (isomerizing)|uniref:SIS domain-containing protein n=1 Tax=Rubrobacter taiwanensis TaxID=185139 RepID=A0A4V2NW62_9ACTN|nr:SIS domain-containing protein [Rubrobacter taiwanensis]TCJ16072.1 SIS domain-containing protein [Rubrobacter taiwanensis]